MRLVLDNSALFAIMNPHSTSAYLFASIRSKFLAPEFIKLELERYREECLIKSELSEHQFEIRQKEIEELIDFSKESEYEELLEKAIKSLSDPKDSPYLALALTTNASIWSNDPHLKEQSLVQVYTTRDLLGMFLNEEI